jgi:hypothetical protein
MNGIENALLANDACGAPIPWLMCCPWLYFDGKLFQYKLLKAENVRGLPVSHNPVKSLKKTS